MMIRDYFEKEMRYLTEAGKVFAETHPELARYLKIDSIAADRDPYVERLFEGFAFLTGRIREQLDDELHQYTEGLCTLLYPHFLKPIPALSIVEFKPLSGKVPSTKVLKKGTEVRSEEVGEEQAQCRFVTTQEVHLHPLSLQDVTLNWASDGTTRVTLLFQLEGGAIYENLDLSPLRLHFTAAPMDTIASLMHLFFTRHVEKVCIGPVEGPGPAASTMHTLPGQRWITPGGLADDEGLLPYTLPSFTGFRLLQEYLAFRRKFWCIDLHGLEQFRPAEAIEEFQVDIFFDRTYPEDQRFKPEDLRLYCTPVVNIFQMDAEPLRVDHQTVEYRVLPSTRYRKSIHVYDIEHVLGIEDMTGKRHEYLPYFSFRHTKAPELRYFTETSRIGPTDHYETYVVLDSGEDDPSVLAVESLSLDLRCTNGSLPKERLQKGMINQLAPEVAKVATPVNLIQPSLILYPPTKRQRDFFWKMISHWSFNYQTVASKEALTGLLALYDWTDTQANPRRIAGIHKVKWTPKEVMHRGGILRGVEVTLHIQEGHFADEGDLCLFGLVMSRFLTMYATLNSVVHLTIEMIPSGSKYQWQPKHGTQPIL